MSAWQNIPDDGKIDSKPGCVIVRKRKSGFREGWNVAVAYRVRNRRVTVLFAVVRDTAVTTRRHWSEKMGCICGWTTYSVTAEAKHRHNFPAMCKRPKISEAGRRLLQTIPDEWADMPIFGDSRPRQPLIRGGFVEFRVTDATPPEMGNSPVRFVRHEWRRTDRGRAAL